MSTKSKTESAFSCVFFLLHFLVFPLVKFHETWQTGSKCFTLVGARFSGKSKDPFFRSAQ